MHAFLIKSTYQLYGDGIGVGLYNSSIKQAAIRHGEESSKGSNRGGEGKLVKTSWIELLDVIGIKSFSFGLQ